MHPIIKKYISTRNSKAAITKWEKMSKKEQEDHIKKMVKGKKAASNKAKKSI